jgi:hypothetical protein
MLYSVTTIFDTHFFKYFFDTFLKLLLYFWKIIAQTDFFPGC